MKTYYVVKQRTSRVDEIEADGMSYDASGCLLFFRNGNGTVFRIYAPGVWHSAGEKVA